MRQLMRFVKCLMIAGLFLQVGCSDPPEEKRVFTITVTGSTSPRPLAFSGTYHYLLDKKRITRDLSGEGSQSASFEADELLYVRVIATDRDGIYSLTVRRDGELLFDTPALPADRQLFYSSE